MKGRVLFAVVIFFFSTSSVVNEAASVDDKKHYIVYIGDHSFKDSKSVISANHEMLASVLGSRNEAEKTAVHHYTKSFRGFSAMLTPDQAKRLSESASVASVFESKTNQLHTTHSWEFLGVTNLEQHNPQQTMDLTSNVVVGVIDTGVWPESKSFNDYGLGPVPTKFKGECTTGQNFTSANCNRKIVGARYYYKGFLADFGSFEALNRTYFVSARDADGHGTHTASTIAGSLVPEVSLYGIGRGTAQGGMPGARLAIYKACWFGFCSDADILSALDDAIDDGVDVISMSLGPSPPQPVYFGNAISIGSFHAFQRGVVVSASAGNSFLPKTAVNVAPWILTVAASTMDRDIETDIYLGNSKIVKGFNANPIEMTGFYGLVLGSAAPAPGVTSTNASFCKKDTLDPALIKGKIVVCALQVFREDRTEKVNTVQQGGGVGIVIIDQLARDIVFQFALPGTVVDFEEAQHLLDYINSDKNPVARISKTKAVLGTKPAPEMATFSSMGPNVITPDIIKPDITAPGVNVLAAWSPVATLSTTGRSIDYNIISGTSMSCPHVSAVAALIKSYHPTWSPAAIKSAIMTTATVEDNTNSFIIRHPNGTQTSPFDYGSGHINATSAINPGLIYDFDTNDIIAFLCRTGATPQQLRNLTGNSTYCMNSTNKPSYDFNYPSIGVYELTRNMSVHRTVTYYGEGPAVYEAKVDEPAGVSVTVVPGSIRFEKSGDKATFAVNFTPYNTSGGEFVFGALTWTDGVHVVRSPIGLNVVSL